VPRKLQFFHDSGCQLSHLVFLEFFSVSCGAMLHGEPTQHIVSSSLYQIIMRKTMISIRHFPLTIDAPISLLSHMTPKHRNLDHTNRPKKLKAKKANGKKKVKKDPPNWVQQAPPVYTPPPPSPNRP